MATRVFADEELARLREFPEPGDDQLGIDGLGLGAGAGRGPTAQCGGVLVALAGGGASGFGGGGLLLR
ncbi:hypothetical protein [Nocardia mangyaensis]|uniref:hypothetical protein n=1 Tax=Nocardia mangyaensis TaxID=2213200 RepID=UPI0012EB129C|nr:hypothetical protein [Nocardia mangyaensis]MDO3645887.1 hypothetical protein [Nocardia mangyaensis]